MGRRASFGAYFPSGVAGHVLVMSVPWRNRKVDALEAFSFELSGQVFPTTCR